MENKIKTTASKYQSIAIDIASKIADGKYNIGEKIYARSSIASTYKVSPETARRAICILDDLNIVESAKGSGVIIKSYENAVKFIKQYQDTETINDIRLNMLKSVDRQKQELDYFNNCISNLIEKTEAFRSVNPFMPFQLTITKDVEHINKSAAEISFWNNTQATIIAIKRNGEIILSPGPYAILKEDDIIYFVGNEECIDRVKKFLNII
ncbi:TrkA C-terminal domain-containing protein [Clostridium sp.]|uniref:TrkA C-terminal domain-containing protein n=1 Tax=Clostridium sp. TaxID=1506 RepID=UPI003F40491A